MYLLASVFLKEGKNLIITDNTADTALLRNFAITFFGMPCEEIREIGELLAMSEHSSGIFFCHPDIFRVKNNLHDIEKNHTFSLSRGDTITPEACIEQLLAFGYVHDNSLEQIFSYKKE